MTHRGRPPSTPAQRARRQAERERWAALVRGVRRLLGDLTQAELAARLKVDVQTVSRWERALSAPSAARRAELIQVSGYEPQP